MRRFKQRLALILSLSLIFTTPVFAMEVSNNNVIVSENEVSISENETTTSENDINLISDNIVSENEIEDTEDIVEDGISENETAISEDDITISEDIISENEIIEPAGDIEEVVSSDEITISDNEIPAISENSSISENIVEEVNNVISIQSNNVQVKTNEAKINKTIEKKGNKYLTEDLTKYTENFVVGQKKLLIAKDIWTTEDKTIATVNKSGKITGKKLGETKIIRHGEFKTTFNVTVVEPSEKGLVSENNIIVPKGKSIEAAITDVWRSGNPDIATVNKSTGEVVAKRAGSVKIDVQGTHNREYIIYIEQPKILVKNKTIKLSVGATRNLLSNNIIETKSPVAYSVANTHIANIDSDLNVHALKSGTTKLYANINGKKFPFTLKIVNNTISEGMVNATEIYLLPNKSFTLKVGFPKKANKHTVTYRTNGKYTDTKEKESYSNDIISVTTKGKIKALSDGMSDVIVNIDGVDKYTVKVIVEGDKVELPESVSLNANDYYLIKSNAQQSIIWKSSKTAVATVNELGIIKGIAPGNAIVSGKISGKTYKIKVKVTAKDTPNNYVPTYDYQKIIVKEADSVNPRTIKYVDISGLYKLVDYYKIKCDLNGGKLKSPNPEWYESKSTVKLSNPTISGNFEFAGWTGSNGKTPQKDLVIEDKAEHLNFKANYKEIKETCTVTFNLNGGTITKNGQTISGKYNVTVPRGQKVSRLTPDPKKTNYTFKYWEINGNEFNFTTPINSNITLNAYYEGGDAELKHSVTFDACNGYFNLGSGQRPMTIKYSVQHEGYTELPPDPISNDQNKPYFSHWEDKQGQVFRSSETVTTDLYLYAVYSKEPISVIF